MANRYWVGGSAIWDGTAGSKWSTTSGGVGGAAVPTSADDVFFNAASGAVTCNISGSRVCKSLTLTGFTGAFVGSSTPILTVSGNINLGGVSLSANSISVVVNAASNITAGGPLSFYTLTAASGGILTFVDDITILNGLLVQSGGTVVGNGTTPTAFTTTVAAGGTVSLGSGTWRTGGWTVDAAATITPGTSTIITSATFSGGGHAYDTLWLDNTATIVGSNTFANLKIDPGVTVTFTAGTTTTVASLTWNGTPSSVITVQSTSAGSAWNLSDSTGSNVVSYCSIKDSAAAGGAAFTALSSTNVSGNSGWTFTTTDGLLLFFV